MFKARSSIRWILAGAFAIACLGSGVVWAQDVLPWNKPDASPAQNGSAGGLPEPVTNQPLEPLPPLEPQAPQGGQVPAAASQPTPAPGVGIDPAAPIARQAVPVAPDAQIAPPIDMPPGWNASPRVGPPSNKTAAPAPAPTDPSVVHAPPASAPAAATPETVRAPAALPPLQASPQPSAPVPPSTPPPSLQVAPPATQASPSPTPHSVPPTATITAVPQPPAVAPGLEPSAPGSPPAVAPLDGAAAIIAPESVGIRWRVENPFRFFSDPKDTNVHRATFLSLSEDERANPILASERALSRRHPEGWAATMYKKTCWNRSKNVFACPNDTDYIDPKSHAVIADVTGANDPSVNCVWRINARGERGGRAEAITKPCNEPVRFDVPYPDGADLLVEIADRPLAKADVQVRDILVAGMGDSFASGEGNPDGPVQFSRERTASYGGGGKDLQGYPARIGAWKSIGDKSFIEENARWLDQACHRSLYSFQLRTALQLSLEDPHRAVTYVGVACSGAEVTAGLFLRYKGNEWVPNPPLLSQISAVAEAQCGKNEAPAQDLPEAYHMKGAIKDLQGGLVLRKCPIEKSRKIDLLLLSVGGNDIGFSRLLANAVLAEKSLLKKLGGWFGEVEGQLEASAALNVLDQRYKSLNRALHNIVHLPWNETDRVVLAAYPPLALLGDGTATCPDGTAGMEVLADFRLSQTRAKDGTWVADKLQHVMADSAKAFGWTFADSHRKAFVGRGICAGYTDNAFSIADDLRLPRMTQGKWVPYNPADYRAYASRQRWFRTPNDAFMTGNFHVSPSLLQKALKFESLSWFQLLLASTYSGAFHPTAEGHAAIADSVTDKARQVLKKYKQQGPELTAEFNPGDADTDTP